MSINEKKSIAQSAVLTVTMRWTDRLIGVASTLILARLLVPDDFGVVAQASLAIGLLTVVTDLGVHIALIQNANPEKSHYDTAWTIRLIQYVFVSIVLFATAPQIGEYFGEVRVVLVLQVMTLHLLMAGIENIGVVTFQKEMRFGLDFRFVFIKRIAGFSATILLAVIWKSYWAMVVGTLVSTATGVVLSYIMHPMRPRFSFSRFADVFSVSQWALLRSIGEYLDSNFDRLLIGARADSRIMGGYTVANEIAMMPSSEVLAPLNRVLFPALVRIKHDIAELNRVFLLAVGVQALIAIPASLGLSMVAPQAVYILLGEQWLFAVPLLQLLALIYAVQAISGSADLVMITLGEIRSTVLLSWSGVVIFAVLAVLIWPEAGALEIAGIRLFSSLAGLLMTFWLLKRILPKVRLVEILRVLLRPLFGASLMALALTHGADLLDLEPAPMLLVKVLIGVVVYVLAVLAAWAIAGRPVGGEQYLLAKVSDLATRLRHAG